MENRMQDTGKDKKSAGRSKRGRRVWEHRDAFMDGMAQAFCPYPPRLMLYDPREADVMARIEDAAKVRSDFERLISRYE